MILNWCLNEPWPTAVYNSIIEYPNEKRLSYEAVKASLRPMMASVKFIRFDFKAGKQLALDLWMLNGTYEEIASGDMEVYFTMDEQRIKIASLHFDRIDKNQRLEEPKIRYIVPKCISSQLARIMIEIINNQTYNSDYYILIVSPEKEDLDINRLSY